MKPLIPLTFTAFLLQGCATAIRIPTSYQVNNEAVKSVVVLSPNDLFAKCRDGGYELNTYYGGCFYRSTKTVFINSACNFNEVLGHEMCHALQLMSDEECDAKMIVKSCPEGYHFGETYPGGRRLGQ